MKTVVYIGLLLGIAPALGITGVMLLALELGARAWPDLMAGVVFGAMYLAMVGCGAYAFSRTRY
jgi:hypothetical protein